MAFATITEIPAQSLDGYRAVAAQAIGDDPPDGLLVQVAGRAEDGLRIVSIWESAVHHDRFVAERLHPALRRVGQAADPAMRQVEFEVGDLWMTAALRASPR